MELRVIQTLDDFVSLRHRWPVPDTTVAGSGIFLSYDWFYCCLCSFRKDKILNIIVAEDGAEIIGLAPFWIFQSKTRGVPVRTMSFIVVPDTPWVDFVIRQGKQKETIEIFMKHVAATQRHLWDSLELSRFSMKSTNYAILRDVIATMGLKSYQGFKNQIPYLEIREDWDTFINQKSKNFRKRQRNIANSIEKMGDITTEIIAQGSVEKVLHDIMLVSGHSWKNKAGVAIPNSRESIHFFECLTSMAMARGWLDVWILKKRGHPVAFEYHLMSDNRIHSLRSDFDETYRDISPGYLLLSAIIKNVFQKGCSEFHLGPGAHEYKFDWTNRVHEQDSITISNNTCAGIAVWFIEARIKPAAKLIRDRLLRLQGKRA